MDVCLNVTALGPQWGAEKPDTSCVEREGGNISGHDLRRDIIARS